jgi:hypothetical protein
MQVRWVKTTNTPGGDGTTNGVLGASRAYATLAEGLTPLHLTTIADAYRFVCVGAAADTGNLDHTAWEFVTSPTNYVEVIGDNTTGQWNDAAYHLSATNRAVIYNQYAAHVRLYNVQGQLKVTDGGDHNVFRLSTANNDTANGPGYLLYKGCIGRIDPTSTSGTARCWIDSILGGGSGVLYRMNCLALGGGSGSPIGFNTDAGAWALANAHSYNLTAANCLYGFIDNVETINGLATGCTYGFIGTNTGDYNANDDGQGIPGANSHDGTIFTFVDALNGDYHLAAADTGARGLGLTDPGSGLFSDDIDGQIRSGAWDIGMDQYVTAGVSRKALSWRWRR